MGRLHRARIAEHQQTDSAAGGGEGQRQAKKTGEKAGKVARKKTR
jgi:hypothetical protein